MQTLKYKSSAAGRRKSKTPDRHSPADRQLNVRLAADLRARFQAACESQGSTTSDVLRALVQSYTDHIASLPASLPEVSND